MTIPPAVNFLAGFFRGAGRMFLALGLLLALGGPVLAEGLVEITVTAQQQIRQYDGTAESDVDPLVGGDDLLEGHELLYGQDFLDKHAGEGKTLVPFAAVLEIGTQTDVTSQYHITLASNETGVITQRTLTLSNFTADWKFADGTTAVTGTGFDDDRLEGDDLEFTYEAAFADAKLGLNKPVLYTNIAISGGADQGNYLLASTEGEATAGIGITVVEATGSTQIEVPPNVRIGALLVAGGGGGAGGRTNWHGGGGGGAGGVKFKVMEQGVHFNPGDILSVEVGTRGDRGGNNSNGSSGGDSALSIGGSTVALARGGGGGGRPGSNAGNGGSGGGASCSRTSGSAGSKLGDCIGNPGNSAQGNYIAGGGGGAGQENQTARRHGWHGITLAELADQTPYDPAVHPDLDEVPGLEQFAAGGGAGGDPGGLGGDGGGGYGRADGFHGGDATNWGSGGAGGYHSGTGGHGYQGIVVLFWEPIPPVPLVYTLPPTDVETESATLHGYLYSTGQSATAVSVYWGPTDGGTNISDWAESHTFPGTQGEGALSHPVDITEDNEYFYRFAASNEVGFVWAEDFTDLYLATEYLVSAVTVKVEPEYIGRDNETALFTFSRPPVATSRAVTVSFTVDEGSTAEAGVHYVDFASFEVTMPLGVATGSVAVSSLPYDDEEEHTLEVVLAGGGIYATGIQSRALLTITNLLTVPITVTAQPDERVYDGTTNSEVTPMITSGELFDHHELVYGQDFADKHVGEGKELLPSVSVINTNTQQDVTAYFPYIITLETNFNGVITKRTLTLSNFTADWKVHDGTTAVTGTGFDDDRIAGDDLEFTYEAAFADAKPGLNKPVLYTNIAISGGADQGNYLLDSGEGQATAYIRPEAYPITVTAQADERDYDGTTNSEVPPLITSGELFGDDTADLIQFFDDKHVGEGKILTPQVLAIWSGEENVTQYYDITVETESVGIITNRILTLSNFTADWKFADGTTAVTGTGFDDDRIAGDELVFSYDAAFADAKPGLNKPVLYTNIAISGGADQGNYLLDSTEGEGTGGIGIMVVEATGSTQIEVPRHVGRIAALLVGGGGSGAPGWQYSWQPGAGGGAGGVKFAVLREGVDFNSGDTINVTVGARGVARSSDSASRPGENSVLHIDGGTTRTALGGGQGGGPGGHGGNGGSGGGGTTGGNQNAGQAVGACLGHDGVVANAGGGGGAGGGASSRNGGAGISLAEISSDAQAFFASVPQLEGHFAGGGGGSGESPRGAGGIGGGGGGGRPNGLHATNWGSGGGGGYRSSGGQVTTGGNGYQGIAVLYFEFMPQGTVIIIR